VRRDLRRTAWGIEMTFAKLAAERRGILNTEDCSDSECVRLLKIEETMPRKPHLNDADLLTALNILEEEDKPFADQFYNRTLKQVLRTVRKRLQS
jgi:hypothetical protein